MNKTKLRAYARLIARKGANVQRGQEVFISAGLDQPEFVQMVVEECYKCKAKSVVVEWYYQPLTKVRYRYESLKTLSELPDYAEARWKHKAEVLPCRIFLDSDDPDGLKGINQEKLGKAQQKLGPIIKHQPAATLDLAIGLTSVFQQSMGGHYRSQTINNMALGSYNASFEPGRTKNDWLTRDEAIVDAYVANPLNQFVFTVNGYYNLFRGLRYSERQVNLDKIPKDLPILVVSGANDPVGEFGKGPRLVAESFMKTGIQDVTLKLYPDDRHEILNELDRETVYQDLLAWIEKRM